MSLWPEPTPIYALVNINCGMTIIVFLLGDASVLDAAYPIGLLNALIEYV